MKLYTSEPINFPIDFNIEVILSPKDTTVIIPVAATEYKGYQIPDGSFMPADKKIKPSAQQITDYKAFIADIEAMLSDHHELKLIYKNKSKNYSNYYFSSGYITLSGFCKNEGKVLALNLSNSALKYSISS